MENHVKKPYETPKAMTDEDISATLAEYKNAAKCAVAAGFDGVQIHSANGYLLDQFIQTSTNKREDKYGGALENRLRFLKETPALDSRLFSRPLKTFMVFHEFFRFSYISMLSIDFHDFLRISMNFHRFRSLDV